MFPPIDPFASGLLPRGDGVEIYWETSGNPNGIPVLYLHGGPGSGLRNGYRSRADPSTHLMVGLDQRGSGRSIPLAADDLDRLDANATPTLVADIEALREMLRIQSWIVVGGSWGSTLALAYAQAHPDVIQGLVLVAVTTTSRAEVQWITEDISRIFPEQWHELRSALVLEPHERLVDGYARVLRSPDREARALAAAAWCRWEDAHVSLNPGFEPSPRFRDPEFRENFALLVTHYWSHSGFGGDDLLPRMDRLDGVPGILIHGKHDISGPLVTAWNLHRAWPGSELVVGDEGHGGTEMTNHMVNAIARLSAAPS